MYLSPATLQSIKIPMAQFSHLGGAVGKLGSLDSLFSKFLPGMHGHSAIGNNAGCISSLQKARKKTKGPIYGSSSYPIDFEKNNMHLILVFHKHFLNWYGVVSFRFLRLILSLL